MNRNSIEGSAICAFNLTAINSAFRGPFKYQESLTSTWERKESEFRNQFECEFNIVSSKRHDTLTSSHRFQLMDDAVQPITPVPLYSSEQERLTNIALDIIQTKIYSKVRIIFVATKTTEQHVIKKLSITSLTKTACVVEIWDTGIKKDKRISTLQYLEHTESLYVGTEISVIRIPVKHCGRHGSKSNCLSAMDPYCGWNDLQQNCTSPPENDPLKRFWIQQSNECPNITSPIDGGFSAWSEWFNCNLHSDDYRHESRDSCLCKTRRCNNPTPTNGGTSCKGRAISILLTVDG